MNKVFKTVGALRPRRNTFDLTYRKNFTADMGALIPTMCDEVVPGDHIKIGNQVVVRMQPMVAPVMHEITATIHYFFVPYRILWEPWEDYIASGTPDNLPAVLPAYEYTGTYSGRSQLFTLWDYFGFPVFDGGTFPGADNSHAAKVMTFPWWAYNRVYNDYYRDENLQEEVSLDNPYVIHRNWAKDYFTSALPFRQKGQPPALPVNVQISGTFPYGNSGIPVSLFGPTLTTPTNNTPSADVSSRYGNLVMNVGGWSNIATIQPPVAGLTDGTATGAVAQAAVNPRVVFNTIAPTATSTTFNVSDLRLAFQTQKWLERNARGGTRYTEFLRSHFGVSPTDARLDRPEYIGGVKVPVVLSEVLQTAPPPDNNPSYDNAVGRLGGHGLAADIQYAGDYNVQEYGLIIGMFSVMPKPAYQDGINRQWLRRLPTDFYFPEFAHLSEQAIYQAELRAMFGAYNEDYNIFGYTGQYDEMRVKHDMVCTEMRIADTAYGDDNLSQMLSYWNMARKFPGKIDNIPHLNSQFVTCDPTKRIFASGNTPGMIVNVSNLISATRPMPLIAEPGLIDHF